MHHSDEPNSTEETSAEPAAATSNEKEILLADHQIMMRQALAALLESALPSVRVRGAASVPEALAMVAETSFQLAIVDCDLPGRGGLYALADLRALRPQMPVIILCGANDAGLAVRAVRSGAAAYLEKTATTDELIKAVSVVLDGRHYVTEQVALQLMRYIGTDNGRPRHETLSNRELQILKLIAAGRAIKRIGGELSLSAKTVSTYRARIMAKMAFETNAQMIRYCLKHQLIIDSSGPE